MTRRLVVARPKVAQVMAQTASDNVYMIGVNHSLRYTDSRTLAYYEITIDESAARLAL
ncbi:hypothetical protein [Catenulispora pinisilvae]|uniref:hypothetical protein n=1 Tax=Catenulispora pinisilvae TaxID=2705253 RepID=UPI001890E55D|nr:hypothetical protein [Catenulispora pinisilvae]